MAVLLFAAAACSSPGPAPQNSAAAENDPRAMLPRRDLAEQKKVDYATAVRCLWLANGFVSNADKAFALKAMRVRTQARFFANQHATEAGKTPTQVEQDLLDMTAVEAKSAPPGSGPMYCFGGNPECLAAQKEAGRRDAEKAKRDIELGVRPDLAKLQREEFEGVCIPLLGS
ncbi:hypothetical protein [Sphingomonas sp.]|uniref:hypothetical protein n=1 Tax=Sphingomonas sp. TaxID=28214 RepID=UPI001B132DA3|nr:hypothetical protein [Sphingomonas sp.]MBO9712686.1 hypothetical protein [Sphingomonas sp.]